jgi:hypothetical protein
MLSEIGETDVLSELTSIMAHTTAIHPEVENPRLEFRDGQFFFRMTNLEGGVTERYVSDAAVREAFSKIPIDSGWLRPEIARWGDGKHGEWAVAFFAPAVQELEVTRESASTADRGPQTGDATVAGQPSPVESELQRLRVPLPGLVFFGMGTQYFIWAVKTAKLEPFQEIFRAPLPNVYTDGKVCWGMVKPPRANARSIFTAFDLFIKSTFNNHLASGKSKRAGDDVRGVLRKLADPVVSNQQREHWAYPIEDLVRQVANVGVTLDKALREFMETGAMAE